MTRKSSIVTLCILGAVAAVGACCCCSGMFDEPQPQPDPAQDKDGKQVVHHPVRRRWSPWIIWWGGSHTVGGPHPGTTVSHPIGGGHGTTSSSPRGGFGSTAHGGGSNSGGSGS